MTGRKLRAHRFSASAVGPLLTVIAALHLSAAALGAQPATPVTGVGTSALVVDTSGVQTLLGLPVQTSKGEDLGHVVDVVVDAKGVLMAVIVDFGGFLGVGSRKIAVDWRILHFPSAGEMGKLVADLPRDRLRDAPVYKSGEPIVIMGASTAPAPSPTAPPAKPASTTSKP